MIYYTCMMYHIMHLCCVCACNMRGLKVYNHSYVYLLVYLLANKVMGIGIGRVSRSSVKVCGSLWEKEGV